MTYSRVIWMLRVPKNIVIIIVIVFNKNFNLILVYKRNKWLNKIWKKYEFTKKLKL